MSIYKMGEFTLKFHLTCIFALNLNYNSLYLLYLIIISSRQACIHACGGGQANALQQACDLGKGYAALAVTGLIPALVPDVCLQCTDADKPRAVGETYDFKLPDKQADLVINVETIKVS